MKIKKRYIVIIIWILIIWTLSVYFFNKQELVCPVWEVKILNNCDCSYECWPESYIGWVCDRVCPQEMEIYEIK